MRPDKSTNLDLLRALAVLAVFADHLITTFHYPQYRAAWVLGRMGVLMFFVHTALVLMDSIDRKQHESLWAFKFYVRRGFRIYPLSILFVVIVLAFEVPRATWLAWRPWRLGTILSNLALVQNLTGRLSMHGAMWSLPFELQMYLALPLIFIVLRRWPKSSTMCAVLFAGVFLGVIQYSGLLDRDLFTYVPCFLGGVLAYFLRKRTSPRIPSWIWPVVLISYCAFYVAVAPPVERFRYEWTFCIVLGCFIPYFVDLRKTLFTQSAFYIAQYSYGIYLAHYPIMWLFFKRLTLPPALAWSGFIACSIIAPVILYHFLEEPMISFGKWLTGGRGRLVEATAPAP